MLLENSIKNGCNFCMNPDKVGGGFPKNRFAITCTDTLVLPPSHPRAFVFRGRECGIFAQSTCLNYEPGTRLLSVENE